jgi:Gas vesicle protein G
VGLLTGLLGLPLAPVRGVVWLAEQIRDHAEEQYYDPVRIRAELDRIDEARRTGELSEQECAELENELLQRLMAGRRSPGGVGGDRGR